MTISKSSILELLSLADKIPENGMYEPNLFLNEDDYEACRLIHHEFWDRARYPGTFERLELIRESHRQFEVRDLTVANNREEGNTAFGFFESGLRTASNEFSATGFGAVIRGFHTLDMTILLIDPENETFLYHKPVHRADDVYAEVIGQTSKLSESGNYLALLSGSWDPKDGSGPRKILSKLTHTADLLQADDPVLAHPVRRSNNPLVPGAITIGLGRPYNDQGANSRMDYSWNQAVQSQPKGMLPFVGQAKFGRPIAELKPNENFIVQMAVVNTVGGGGHFEIAPEDMTEVYKGFSIDAADNTVLKWDFPPRVTSPGNPVVFDRIKWPSDMNALLFFKAVVFLDGGFPAQFTIRSFDGAPQNPPDGHLPILPINYVWHCLAKGTEVTLVDGHTKPIEDLVTGDEVLSDMDGNASPVLWTTSGKHYGSAVSLLTDAGKRITLSDNHVVVTEKGMKLAKEIELGEVLFSVAKSSKPDLEAEVVLRVTRLEGFEEEMYNIALQEAQAPQKLAGLYFANGLCVGDASATRALETLRSSDLDFLKSITPALYHRDLESHFEDFGQKS